MPEIFINYRTGDCEQTAVTIEHDLSRRFGRQRVFRASKSIRPGDNYRDGLSAASTGTRVLLALIGPNWLNARDHNGNLALTNENDWTRKEILNAMRTGARIIPILCGRKMPRLSAASLPADLAPLADLQSLTYDTGNAEADLNRIAAELADLVPGLVDRTAKPISDRGTVVNSNTGTVGGNLNQVGELHGPLNMTTFHGSTGPVSTGPGDQQVFYGDGNNYVAGRNSGGIHQNFEAKRERDEKR
ncbi:toll/interleukin-1 receptor domain-containing protein [Saccharopolyspora sp. K220]|uniref:toll/interleukin-1 receptor domain-containing protein n=1 Tax=Saccharopolyspora soli TaxID=2926618 RepID=UPI001F563532|nr:toll/interleukin-1 receptor domain-containing protein [Saccharopolyspora soli]MCI2418346.1 toll/interleukin-1 receptor domain-containing protein [Saccharopolyspora soli]